MRSISRIAPARAAAPPPARRSPRRPKTGLTYTQASTSKPSDSFPGPSAIVTRGSPKSTGTFYDASYDRALSQPTQTTRYSIRGGLNLYPKVIGTQVGFDEEIDVD